MNIEEQAKAFVARWRGVTASELSTAQTFVIELCELLDVPRPHPTADQDYMFERSITFVRGDGSTSAGRIDCYRRGHFVWESKKLRLGPATKGFDDAMLKARQQAEDYSRALPAAEGRPPFVVVVDVGHVIELYSEFTRSGATYTPFPDPRSHRIRLEQLVDPDVRTKLRALWTDPMSLDPARVSAKVTREVAAELAILARSLEEAGNPSEVVAAFLTRCLFSMFAEDVGLLPKGLDGEGSFIALLKAHKNNPPTLMKMLKVFWQSMDTGGFNSAIAADVLRFNGKLFKGAEFEGYVLSLSVPQIERLLRAAEANWREVEPAIFGTLLERALDPKERHALGAHYTPRAYVERLVLPTVVQPLRADWANAQAAALVLAREATELVGRKRDAKLEEARAEIRRFHHQLCTTRVLDPACGSGNFLYVTLEHLKRLEGEVVNQLDSLGETQERLGLEGETVTLQQLRGIELNERAAALAELVLWIGWLQWHVRTRGLASVAEPVVHDYQNIENRDAVLAYDRAVAAIGADGREITRWDGVTYKAHAATGELVPDEAARVPLWTYVNPRPAVWPAAEFVVGNPPFIGNKRMRDALGDGYAEALRGAWTDLPETADFVMYWWHHAAATLKRGELRRFGFITTNSITQIFNRRIVEESGVDLAFAIPDHPWVDSANGAAVRVAMTVGANDLRGDGILVRVTAESPGDDDTPIIAFHASSGLIHPNLSVGANVNSASRLRANLGLSFMGMIPLGAGFWIDDEVADRLGRGSVTGLNVHIRRYRNGKDLTGRPRGLLALDFFGLTEEQVRHRYPAAYQWLLERVKPQRDQDKRDSRRRNWWLFAESVPKFRAAVHGLRRYIGTTETSKHRLFSFIEGDILPDQKIRSVVSDDAFLLGVLSSVVHVSWAPRAGGRMGVGNDPVYNNTRCFEPFPFPSEDTGLTPEMTERIRHVAEQLDAHRKTQQTAHEEVTLTGLYNVLEKLRRSEPLTTGEKNVHEKGLVSVLQLLHDELDAAVLQAYGWADLGVVPWADETARNAWTETLLERLVALNAKRAAEEASGTVRWLRPEFQDPAMAGGATGPEQMEVAGIETRDVTADLDTPPSALSVIAPQPWPSTLPTQVRAVAQVLAGSPAPLSIPAIEAAFKGKGPWKKGLPRILDTLEALGRAHRVDDTWRA